MITGEAGINIVHINTELRVAWRRDLERSLEEHKTEVVPQDLPAAVEAMKQIVASHLRPVQRQSGIRARCVTTELASTCSLEGPDAASIAIDET